LLKFWTHCVFEYPLGGLGTGLVKSVTSQFGDSQLSDIKLVTSVSQFGDSHNLSTDDIFLPYISRMPMLQNIIVENNF